MTAKQSKVSEVRVQLGLMHLRHQMRRIESGKITGADVVRNINEMLKDKYQKDSLPKSEYLLMRRNLRSWLVFFKQDKEKLTMESLVSFSDGLVISQKESEQ